jgi:lipopolysaccharide/colanic/teichoic acid biosynthesis glycosyltransferase
MIRQTKQDADALATQTVWGLDSNQLHARFWAARGVQVVCRGDDTPVSDDAELFLMVESTHYCLFRIDQIIDTLSWLKPKLLFVRVHSHHEHGYREQIITDDQDRFIRFHREYGGADCRLIRTAVCSNPQIAELWRSAPDNRTGWRLLRQNVPQVHRTAISINGSAYYKHLKDEHTQFIRELITIWRRPDTAIRRAKQMLDGNVWIDQQTQTHTNTRFIGPVWVGAGRQLDGIDSVVGPAVLWDDPKARPKADSIRWNAEQLTAGDDPITPARRLNQFQKASKRAFDISASLLGLTLTLPMYPLIMLIIWLEDGRPFFFAHRRETRGGKEFPCLKFRTMRNNAEQLKQELAEQNKCDGPQFFIEDDPRITRFGRFMRKCNIDELPQFLNVLIGHMSIVGPRPSPHNENQYCPPWREARLSVRPGISGLWQVMRSREDGLDFQEWIRYDIEYVENSSWKMDMWIIYKTIKHLLGLDRAPKASTQTKHHNTTSD